jgi:hypothetical protein
MLPLLPSSFEPQATYLHQTPVTKLSTLNSNYRIRTPITLNHQKHPSSSLELRASSYLPSPLSSLLTLHVSLDNIVSFDQPELA